MKHSNAIKPVVDSIVQARKAKNLSQTELGKRLGLPQSYISRLESGRVDIRLSGILEIARYLGLELLLVPLNMVPLVTSIVAEGSTDTKQIGPLYTLDDVKEETLEP